jgi:hypothetical protein
VQGVAVSQTQINLTWNASTDTGGSGLKGYRVYRNNNLIDRLADDQQPHGPHRETAYDVSLSDLGDRQRRKRIAAHHGDLRDDAAVIAAVPVGRGPAGQ